MSIIFSHKKPIEMQVNKQTLPELDPDQLSDAITAGKANISIEDIDTSINLIAKLIEALSGRTQLRRRVSVLENIAVEQQRAIQMLVAKL